MTSWTAFFNNRVATSWKTLNVTYRIGDIHEKTEEQLRQRAVQRHRDGESPTSIYFSLGRSKAWLYKWLSRYDPARPDWFTSRSKQPQWLPTQCRRSLPASDR
ncbi:MAG: helix-turn-helix domain-containing protein [Porticoccaceae bacterium]|nr:helix-turn-helix domain-containing protein [Porticoccaceae bacterium]